MDLKRDAVVGTLTGYQAGEHFGASLTMTDLNKDGLDDIVIGAPHYTDFNSSEFRYEIGAVYVYYQQPQRSFRRGSPYELILKGQTTGCRFGHAVAALGDANADGYNDLVSLCNRIDFNFLKHLFVSQGYWSTI